MSRKDEIAEILAEWRLSAETDAPLDPEAVIAAHPEHADSLRAHFAVVDAVEKTLVGELEGTPAMIGDYRIVREIGRGGMGVVYEAEQTTMRRRVALKVLSLAVTGSPHAVKRFQREAQAAGRLQHTHIVPVYAMGQHEGYWYYAMELVQGRALSAIIAQLRDGEHRPTEESLARATMDESAASTDLSTGTADRAYFIRVAEAFAGVADALALAHHEGIIHRDIKPSNLLLAADGALKVVDFGLARFDQAGPSMTVTGDLLGTPIYMSPEQAMAKRMGIDHRTDIYSLGVTMYELLTLHPPFRGKTLQQVCSQIIAKDPRLPRRANKRIPKDLETIVLKAMEKDPDRRYQTARAFARDLRLFAEGSAIRARPVGATGRTWRVIRRHKVRSSLIAAVVLLALAGSVLGVSAWREAERRTEAQYGALCRRARGAIVQHRCAHAGESHRPTFLDVAARENAAALFTEAIALLPKRPDAYFGRALARGRTTQQRLDDLAEARAYGLPETTFHLARAHVYRTQREWEAAEAEERLSKASGAADPADWFFEGQLLAARGERAAAIEKLTRCIDATEKGHPVRNLALHARARAWEKEGDTEKALNDLFETRAAGDTSVDNRLHIASLWRRLEPGRAEKLVAEAVEETREVGAEAAWTALGLACWNWSDDETYDRVSAEALELFPESAPLLAARALVDALEVETRLDLIARAIEREPRNPSHAVVRGTILLNAKRHEPAVGAFDRALALDPQMDLAHANRGLALHGLGQTEEALAAVDLAIELAPYCPWARVNRGILRGELGRHKEALEDFDLAVRLNPLIARAHYNRANCLWSLERHEESMAAFDRATTVDPELTVAWANWGILLTDLRRFPEARQRYERAIAVDPTYANAHYNLGVLFQNTRRWPAARRAFAEAARLDPDYGRAWAGLCLANLRMKEYDQAYQAALKAKTLVPDLHVMLECLAEASYELKMWSEALHWCNLAIEDDPKCHIARVFKARTLRFGLHDLPQAAEVYAEAILNRPKDHLLRGELGDVYRWSKQYEKAIEVYKECLKIKPGQALKWDQIGGCFGELGKLQESVDAHQKAVDLEPDNALFVINLASALGEQGKTDRATELTARAAGLAPDNAHLQASYGAVLLWEEQYENAVAPLRRAIDLDPKRARAYADLEQCLRKLDRLEEAQTLMEEACRRLPNHAGLRARFARVLIDRGEEERALQAFDRAIDLGHRGVGVLNHTAWLHATRKDGNPKRAVKLAELALEEKEHPDLLNTLGVARYRAGMVKEALAALERALAFDEGKNASNWFFVAMARWRLGEKEKAREAFRAADAWMNTNAPEDEELLRFRAEAEQLLGGK